MLTPCSSTMICVYEEDNNNNNNESNNNKNYNKTIIQLFINYFYNNIIGLKPKINI